MPKNPLTVIDILYELHKSATIHTDIVGLPSPPFFVYMYVFVCVYTYIYVLIDIDMYISISLLFTVL